MTTVNICNCGNRIPDLMLDICKTHVSYVCLLRSNLESMAGASADLRELKNSMMDLIETAEKTGEQRKKEVEEWFKEVSSRRAEAEKLYNEGQQELDKFPCVIKVAPIYKVGSDVVSVTEKLTALNLRGVGYRDGSVSSSVKWCLGNYIPRIEDEQYSGRKYDIVGSLNAYTKEVLKYLEGSEEWVVGVLGRGGVGKTLLLELIIEHFTAKKDFNVIYVNVKDLGEKDTQRIILEQMGFLNDWRRENVEGAPYMCEKSGGKKYILLLDDIRKTSFRFEDVVGKHEKSKNPFKVVFTTRRKVSEAASYKTVILETLKEEDARNLLEQAARIDLSTRNGRIQSKSVPAIITLCGGVASALVKIGEALVQKHQKQDWDDKISFLKNPKQHEDISGLLERMKYSYELLDQECQECFLQSCVFLPGDSYISSYELEDLMIYGGCFIHFQADPDANRTHARQIMGSLIDEGLIEIADGEVKLNHLVRCMGLWLAKDRRVWMGEENSSQNQNQKQILMTDKLSRDDTLSRYARRNLSALFVTNKEAPVAMHRLFKRMNALTIIKLSGSGVEELPKSISGLKSVKYVDISFTEITKLRGRMNYLHYLNVNGLDLGFDGLKRVISKSSCLQVLRMMCTFHCENWIFKRELHVLEEQMLNMLNSLERLDVLDIQLSTSRALTRLFNYFELWKKVRLLSIKGFIPSEIDEKGVVQLSHNRGTLVELLVSTCRFKELTIIPCSMGFNNITKVTVEDCHTLEELTCLVLLKFLQVMKISKCDELKEIIRREKLPSMLTVQVLQEDIFPDIAQLHLESLPRLECIYQCCHSGDLPQQLVNCRKSLPLKNLRKLLVDECPSLKKLPFGADSKDGKRIKLQASEEWWNAIDKADNDSRSE